MGMMKQIYTEVEELVETVLRVAEEQLDQDAPSRDVVTHEIGRYLGDMGWLTPTEAAVMTND